MRFGCGAALGVSGSRHFDTYWQRTFHAAMNICKHTIYGLFVEEILKPDCLYPRTAAFHHIVYDLE